VYEEKILLFMKRFFYEKIWWYIVGSNRSRWRPEHIYFGIGHCWRRHQEGFDMVLSIIVTIHHILSKFVHDHWYRNRHNVSIILRRSWMESRWSHLCVLHMLYHIQLPQNIKNLWVKLRLINTDNNNIGYFSSYKATQSINM